MCGIFTYIGNQAIDIKSFTDVIHHRGPDSDGFLTYAPDTDSVSADPQSAHNAGKKVALGFRRLAIIDLNTISNQPLSLNDGKYHVVFNGEIYNFIELRNELKSLGTEFRTDSDTEVLLQSYKTWGVNCFNRFNGMWACSILDLERKKLVISRDRFGIKPLYYLQDDHGLLLASEIKQIRKAPWYKPELNQQVLRDFLENAVLDASEQTFYQGVLKFPAAHYAEIDLTDAHMRFKPTPYWDLTDKTSTISYVDAVDEFRNLFQSSIELRFRSDVPVGACLSGGLDSSSIVSLSGYLGKTINTFTIDNRDQNLSEIRYVQDVVGKYNSLTSVVDYNQDNDLELLDTLYQIQDEPISGMGVSAQYKVMQLASANDVVVLLDGQGGDELFGGYRKFVFFYLKELIAQRKFPLALKEASRFLTSNEFKLFEKEGIRRYLNKTGVVNYLTEAGQSIPKTHNIGLSGSSGFKSKSYDDIFKYSYPQLLRYEDRNSMAFSLESRVPFLDYRLVEFVYNLPSSYKLRNGFTKAVLRDSMKGILPDSVRLRKSKMGFATPEKRWVMDTHRAHFIQHFRQSQNPFIHMSRIADELESGHPKLDYKSILRIYLFDRWYTSAFA